MNSKITYHQQVSYCGKPRCRKCREGTGHGPYWYAYQTIDGRTTRTYVGKHLPPEAQAAIEGVREPGAHTSDLERATIRIYVLGQFRLERRNPRDPLEWQTVTESAWQHQRVRALLGCLVSVGTRKLGREQLMDALWPDLDLEMAASRLDRAVYSLRQLFEPNRNRLATSPLLLTEREVLVLAEHPQIWIDADAFEHLLTQAHETQQDPGEKERLLEEAATLYGGDFLPEERKNEWTLARRESLQRSWIGLLLDLADLRIERAALNSAIEPLDRLLSIDPTNEAAVQRLISLLAQLGRRGEALRAYKRLSAVLQQEYRIAPLPETRALYEAVRAGSDTPRLSTSLGSATGRREQDTRARTPSPNASALAAVQIGRSQQSELVGREQELGMLYSLVTTTEQTTRFRLAAQKRSSVGMLDGQKRPQCTLLLGDVGIGKTRLAEEVSREARRRDWAVAWSRVYAQEGSIPYRLWTEVLRKAMAQGAWQRQEVSKRPLVFQPLSALLPELHNLLPQVSYPASLPPEQEQLRLWEAARELLTVISESTPLLIALDDLQWADGSSCELLAYLARRVQGHPIVIVGTCRENELAPNHPLRSLLTELQRENAVEMIQLDPLSDEQIVSLVSQVPHLPEPIVEGIRTRAAGNPFFAEELARTIGTQLVISGAAEDASAVELDGTQLPETITAVLDLRLARLSQPCQRLLSKAAVLGSSFQFQIINAMEAITPGSNEDIVLDLLEEGLRSGMLTEEGIGTRITYHFWHPLLESHLYKGLSAARRASLHRRAADIFRQFYQHREEEGAATIVRHLIKGGADAQQIERYAEMAGDHAYKLPSYSEAEEHYQVALEHLRMVLQANPVSKEEQLHLANLLEYLGECARIHRNHEDARQFYEEALVIHKGKHIFSSSEEQKQEAQIQALLWCEIGLSWYNASNLSEAQQCYKQSEQVLREVAITTGPAWAYLCYQQSYLTWRAGNYEEARRTAHEALQLFEDVLKRENYIEPKPHLTRIKRILAGDSINLGRVYVLLGIIAGNSGQLTEALSYLNKALLLYEQKVVLREIAIVCCDLGDTHMRRAEYSAAQSFFRRSLNLAEQVGEKMLVSFVFGNLGLLDLRIGNLMDAETELRQSIGQAEHINDLASVSLWCAYLATASQEQHKISDAGISLHQALSISHAKHITPYIGAALVAVGGMRVAQAIAIEIEQENNLDSHKKISRALRQAKKSLRHALSLEGLEAETRTEGKVILTSVLLRLGEIENALRQAMEALEDARQFELTWLVARAQRVLGIVLATQGEYERADTYFNQALRAFRRSGMRLEYAQTLQAYGEALVRRDDDRGKEYQRGLGMLQEARQIFAERKAELGLRVVERALAKYEGVGKV